MNKAKFSDHINTLDAIFQEYRTAVQKIEQEAAKTEEDYKASQRNPRLSELRKGVAKEELAAVKEEAREAKAAAQSDARQAMNRARRDLVADVDEFLRVNPDRVDSNTVALLQSGALSDSDLDSLAAANASNVTMLKMIRSAAEARKDNSNQAHELYTKIGNFMDASSRLAVFDKCSYLVEKAFSPLYTDRLGELWDTEFKESSVGAMDALNSLTGE